MADKTPEEVVETTAPAAETATPEKTEDTPVGEIARETAPSTEERPGKKKEAESVPLAVYLESKDEIKELRKEIKAMKAAGISQADIDDELKAIAEEFGTDENFVARFSKVMEQRFEKKQAAKSEQTDAQKRFSDAIEKQFNVALEREPGYAGVADLETIKELAALKKNASKTVPQLIEDIYGKALPGKRTITPTLPGGGKEPAPLDMARARKDGEYFKEVMADPKLKAEYNKRMVETM